MDKDSAARSATLQTLARKFINNKYLAAAFVCLHGVFYPRFPSIRTLKDDELGKMLSLFAQYVHRLHDLAFEAAPCEKPNIRRIFGFSLTDNGRASFVPAGTYLHREIVRSAPADTQMSDDGATISNAELTRLFSRLLRGRLHVSLLDEDVYCRQAEGFRNVCLSFTILGKCNSYSCNRLHTAPSDLTPEWYNRQILLHIFQIYILSNDIKENAAEYVNKRVQYQE